MNENVNPGPDMGDRAKEVGASMFAAGASGVVTHLVGQRVPSTFKGKVAAQGLFGVVTAGLLELLGAPRRIVEGAAGGALAAIGVRTSDQLNLNGELTRLLSSSTSTDAGTGTSTNNQVGAGQGNPATSGYADQRAYADR